MVVCDGVRETKQDESEKKKKEREIKLRSSRNYPTDDNRPTIYMHVPYRCIEVEQGHPRGVYPFFSGFACVCVAH